MVPLLAVAAVVSAWEAFVAGVTAGTLVCQVVRRR